MREHIYQDKVFGFQNIQDIVVQKPNLIFKNAH
jgi:hypothetical protein